MDAAEFLKARERMCHFCAEDCDNCPISQAKGKFVACRAWIQNHPEEAVAIVEKWAQEHPRKTRQSEFLKHYPDARTLQGVLTACPRDVFASSRDAGCGETTCTICKRFFWMQEVEP